MFRFSNLHASRMIKLLIAENVIIRYFLLANPACLLCLLVAFSTARLVLPHKEDLAELDCAVLAPEAGLVVQLPEGKEPVISEGLHAGGTLLWKITILYSQLRFNNINQN